MFNKVCILLLAVCGGCLASHRYSEEAQDFTVTKFKEINPQLQWSPDHYLAALSSRFCRCGRPYETPQKGRIPGITFTDEGLTIVGLRDYVRSEATDVEAVTALLESKMADWTRDTQFTSTIDNSVRFGCSVQPACNGNAIMTCLFAERSSFG